MTTQELRDELAASLGNRTDITDARYVSWLNWAMFDLCGFHRKRLFDPLQLHQLESDFTFTTTPVTGTAQAGTSNTITLAAAASAVDDYYNNQVIEITSGTGNDQKALIIDYDGSTRQATVATTWDTTPNATSVYAIYKRSWHLINDLAQSADRIWTIQLLQDLTNNGKEVEQKNWKEIINVDWTQTGDPEEFCRRGDSMVFNRTPDEAITYRAWIILFPALLSASNMGVEPELPEYWHEALVLGATYRGHSKLMEPERAIAAKQEYVDAVNNKRSSYQVESEFVKSGMGVRVS